MALVVEAEGLGKPVPMLSNMPFINIRAVWVAAS
jgi:hypothetical protein